MPSSKISSEDEFLLRQLRQQVAGNYAAFWNEDRDALCLRALRDVLKEVGAERMKEAVMNCIKYENTFTEEKLRQHIPEKKMTPSFCPRCKDSDGWLYVLVDGDRSKMPRTLRCRHNDETHFTVVVGPSGFERKAHAVACDSIQEMTVYGR